MGRWGVEYGGSCGPWDRHFLLEEQVMKKLAMAGLALGLLVVVGVLRAQEAPPIPSPPQAEHKLLEQFVGEWEGESEVTMMPGEPAMKV